MTQKISHRLSARSFASRVFPWYERRQVFLQARLDQGLSSDTWAALRCPQDYFRYYGSTFRVPADAIRDG